MEVKNLDFQFKNQPQPLFKNLSLQIQPEKLTVFLGPSGCGKSTLLRIFAGLQKVATQLALYQGKRASFVFQEASLLPWLTSEKNIMLPLKLSSEKIDLPYFEKIIRILKIQDCLEVHPTDLSGGQKMRVSIARALVTRPQVLFMDEPFSALDEPTRLKLQDELLEIQSQLKMTILFVTHSFYEAVYLGDRILILSNEKPVQVIYDQSMTKTFKSRFDLDYQKKVQEISTYFEGPHA